MESWRITVSMVSGTLVADGVVIRPGEYPVDYTLRVERKVARLGRQSMQTLWGLLMAATGLFMLLCGTLKSEFIVYRLMVARSRILWGQGDNVHRFYQASGLIVMILGLFWTLGFIWS
jgi:hypothetical protein